MRFSYVVLVIIIGIITLTILFGVLSFTPSLRTKPADKKKPPPKKPDPPTCVTLHRWTKVSFWVFVDLTILFSIVFLLKELYYSKMKNRRKEKQKEKHRNDDLSDPLLHQKNESIVRKNEKYRKEKDKDQKRNQEMIYGESDIREEDERGGLEYFFNFLVFLSVIAFLVGYVGLWVSWTYGEQCFDLRKYILIYLIFMAVLAGVITSCISVWQGLKDGGMGWKVKRTYSHNRQGNVWENI